LAAKNIKAIELLSIAEIVTYWRSLCRERTEHKRSIMDNKRREKWQLKTKKLSKFFQTYNLKKATANKTRRLLTT
jgi:hypothetical protein